MELIISDQTYTEWEWRDIFTKETVNKATITINPCQQHLFHGDIVDEITEQIITPSPIRSMKAIPCILDYKSSTHGRTKDGGKLLYRCIPNDKSIPHFIVPYQAKTVGFEKNKINKYILIQFKEWLGEEKHPVGVVVNMLGDVDNYDSFTEYQLYCKGLVISLGEFNKQTAFIKNKKVVDTMVDKVYEKYEKYEKYQNNSIENRTHLNIFSIDPQGCTDIDDAIGIVEHLDYTVISVYISNVPLIVDYFNLWNHMTEKCSTIYLPMHKLPMLPTILSENICSLLQDELRFALAMDIRIPHKDNDKDNNKATAVTFKPVLIKVSRNYVYEEPELLNDIDYQSIFKLAKGMNKNINDSHDLVEHFMIYMNSMTALKLVEHKCGILRSAHMKSTHMKSTPDLKESLPTDVNNFIINWKYAYGEYCSIENKSSHDFIGYDVYTHITSPIRRLVDVINMTLLQKELGLIDYINKEAHEFTNKWCLQNKIDFINTSMKSIKKVQTTCSLLALHIKEKEENTYKQVVGYVFDINSYSNSYNNSVKQKHKYKYNVYIPTYKMVTTFKTNEVFENYSKKLFTLHLIMDEASLNQKIRLQLL